jgi:hypothetical protein
MATELSSESEERAYAQRVLGDLSITIDGKNVQPVLTSLSFPEPAQTREGLGEIHIEYRIACDANILAATPKSNPDHHESSPDPNVDLPHECARPAGCRDASSGAEAQ